MFLRSTEERLQKIWPTSTLSSRGRGGKQWVLNLRKEDLKSAGCRKILRELAPAHWVGLGSVVPLVLSPVNQLHNSTLQCKLKFFIPTVCQRGLFIFVFWIQQLVTEVKCFYGSFSAVASWGGVEIKMCVWLIHLSSTCKAQLFPKCRSLGSFKTLKK